MPQKPDKSDHALGEKKPKTFRPYQKEGKKFPSPITDAVISSKGSTISVQIIPSDSSQKKEAAVKTARKKCGGPCQPYHNKNALNNPRGFVTKNASHNNSTKGSASRAAAAKIVTAVECGRSLMPAVSEHTSHLDEKDTALVTEIVNGTLRHRRLLCHTLMPLLKVKIPSSFRNAQNLLLTALYQLCFMRTPPHAVVSAAVGACAMCRCQKYRTVINAVLRRFLREDSRLTETSDPAVKYSFPDWLYLKLHDYYGDLTQNILASSNEHAPLWLRICEDKEDPKDYEKLLSSQGIKYALSPLLKSAVLLEKPMPSSKIPLFKEGKVVIQDLSAQLAAPLLLCEDSFPNLDRVNLKILDCCAAPGGKTAHLAALAPKAQITAVEIDHERAKTIVKLMERLGHEVNLIETDAATLSCHPLIADSFDRILVDAPCSGTGVIRRHPDIKWLRRQSDLENLTHLQEKILDEASKLLKEGGVLLYTTCSLLREENQDRVEAFLKNHPDFKLLPFVFKGTSMGFLQRLPGDDGGDGFFYARFIKAALL